MKLLGFLIFLALIVSLGWGVNAGSRPAPPRPADMTIKADAAWNAALPADPEKAAQAYLDRVPAEMRARGEAVSQTRYWVFGAHVLLTVLAGAVFLFTGAAAKLRDWAGKITPNAHQQVALYAFVFLAALFVLMAPVDVYRGYVRPRTFGFSDQPFGDWLRDLIVNWAIYTAFYVIGIVAIYAMIRRWPRAWVLWATGIYTALTIVFVVLSPSVIEPLFNKQTPLAEGPLREQILSLARANDVPVSGIVVADASRQTRIFNAHVSGFGGAAQITLNDTTLTSDNIDGIRWVMGHEIGHYVMGHVMQSILVGAVVTAFGFAFIAWIMGILAKRFGARWGAREISDVALLPLLWCLFLFWNDAGAPLTNAYSRAQEKAADIYGLNASQAPNGMAEFCIHDADTARLAPTPLDIFLFYDHPSDKARVEMAMRWRAEHLPAAPTP